MKAAKASTGTGPKILVQYRASGGKVYELKSAEAVLVVHISQSEGSTEQWHVQARSGAETSSVVDGWGPTRAEAFGEAARVWKAHNPPLAPFDWDAIAHELRVVQAL